MTFFDWGASAVFHDAEAPALDFVHLATADPSFNTRVAEKSTFCSFDPGQDLLWYTRPQLEAIISSIAILFANRHEMAQMCDMLDSTQEAVIRRIPIVVLTMDAEGSMLFTKGKHETIPIIPVKLADPTGAGDAYRAGFLTAFSRGYAPLVCARVGTTTASFTVEKVGCQTNLPTWGAMEERYAHFFGPLGKEEVP